MKKKEFVVYAKCVPQEIKDLMGYQPYDYIKNYNTQGWLNSSLRTPNFDHLYVESTILYLDDFPSDIIGFKDALIDQINDPDFISGRIFNEYYDDYSDHKIIFTKQRKLSEAEIKKIQDATTKYEEEKIVFEKLQAIITPLKKQAELETKNKQAEKIKKEIDKLNKQLSKL